MAMLLREVMTPLTVVIDRSASIGEARDAMRQFDVRHLPVLDGETLVGMVSERDLGTRETAPSEKTVADVMQPGAYAAAPTTPLSTIVRHMHDQRYGSTVVVDGGRVVGIFTSIDALGLLLEHLEREDATPGA